MRVVAGPLLLWSLAIALGGLGTGLLFEAAAGLNWGLWTLAGALGVPLCARMTAAPMRASLPPLALAVAFAAAAAITGAPAAHAVICVTVTVLLAIAVLLAGDTRWERLTAPFMLWVPAAAPLLALGEAIRRVHEMVGLVATPRYLSLVRGALLALPVTGLFTLSGIELGTAR